MEPKLVRASHILVSHEHEAKDLERKLKEGETFENLAQKFSSCPSSRQGGDLGSFTKDRMVEPFGEVAFSLKIGEISPPVRTRFGYHLIKRTE